MPPANQVVAIGSCRKQLTVIVLKNALEILPWLGVKRRTSKQAGSFVIGFQTDSQKRIFYSFDFEDRIPQNHFIRGISQSFDLGILNPNQRIFLPLK